MTTPRSSILHPQFESNRLIAILTTIVRKTSHGMTTPQSSILHPQFESNRLIAILTTIVRKTRATA